MPKAQLVLPSRPESINQVEVVLARLLSPCLLDGIAEERITIAVREAVANAIEHGNAYEPGRRVVVDLALDDGQLTVAVHDEGSGFDPARVPDPRRADRLLARRGRGWLLMTSCVNQVGGGPGDDGGFTVMLRQAVPLQVDPQEADHPWKSPNEHPAM